jgi:hypothetical protein
MRKCLAAAAHVVAGFVRVRAADFLTAGVDPQRTRCVYTFGIPLERF